MNLSGIFNDTASGDTPLMQAAKRGDPELMKKLLEHGASPPAAPANVTMPGNITPVGGFPRPGIPVVPKARSSAKDLTEMATEREVKAPATARFKKKPQKRKTTL